MIAEKSHNHAHNAEAENFSSGAAISAQLYAALFADENADICFYDDAELTASVIENRLPLPQTIEELNDAAAIDLVFRCAKNDEESARRESFLVPTAERELVANEVDVTLVSQYRTDALGIKVIGLELVGEQNDGRWKHFSGTFTKLGAVSALLEAVDDVFVISKTGDELVLSFTALPESAPNKKYIFLLHTDGYSKETDINSGSPEAVYPMPFKAMSNIHTRRTNNFR